MDPTKILEDLRNQHALLGECIAAFERLGAGKARRGRPPKWMKAAKPATAEGTKRPYRRKKPAVPKEE